MGKINVLQYICPQGLYGAEMWILALAKHLDPDQINCQLVITKESEIQNIEIYDRFQNLGLTSHQIKMTGRFDLRVVWNLYRLILQEKINIIHTHGYKSDILGLIAARLAGIKTVSTPHGFTNAKDFKLQMFIRLGCFALKHFDRVAPLSEELKSDFLSMGVDPKKVRLIVNGVDLDEIELDGKKSPATTNQIYREKRIGYVGQIDYRKNLEDLLKTFDLLHKDHKNIRLLLIGDGPLREELERQARSMASSARIEFLGYRADRLEIVKELDLFCMTSSLEGIPRCMMEAMAMEIPVAAYNIPGVDHLIINGKTGLLAEFGRVDRLKECWERLLFDEKFAEEVARNGREHVFKNFSAKRMAEKYTGLYQEILNSS